MFRFFSSNQLWLVTIDGPVNRVDIVSFVKCERVNAVRDCIFCYLWSIDLKSFRLSSYGFTVLDWLLCSISKWLSSVDVALLLTIKQMKKIIDGKIVLLNNLKGTMKEKPIVCSSMAIASLASYIKILVSKAWICGATAKYLKNDSFRLWDFYRPSKN